MKAELLERLQKFFGPEGERLGGRTVKVLDTVSEQSRSPGWVNVQAQKQYSGRLVQSYFWGEPEAGEISFSSKDVLLSPQVYLGLVPAIGESQELGVYDKVMPKYTPERQIWHASRWPRKELIAQGINPDEDFYDVDFQRAAIARLGFNPDTLNLDDPEQESLLMYRIGTKMLSADIPTHDLRLFYDQVTGGRFG